MISVNKNVFTNRLPYGCCLLIKEAINADNIEQRNGIEKMIPSKASMISFKLLASL